MRRSSMAFWLVVNMEAGVRESVKVGVCVYKYVFIVEFLELFYFF